MGSRPQNNTRRQQIQEHNTKKVPGRRQQHLTKNLAKTTGITRNHLSARIREKLHKTWDHTLTMPLRLGDITDEEERFNESIHLYQNLA